MRKSDRLLARQRGELNAARELRRLGASLTHAIDIFGIIARQQIWLIFQPVEGPLGVHLPGGILINSKRRLGVQRLTAAHEYGHHVMHHQVSIDDEANLGDPLHINEINEVEAQAFAADFLMPVQLVNNLWNRLNMGSKPSPYEIYLLSLHMGTSYQATAYQLIAQERISPGSGQTLLKVQPKAIKQLVGRGLGPENPWAETWPVDATQSGESISVGMDDEINVQLPESPSTGYLWSIPQQRPGGQPAINKGAEDHREGTDGLSLVRTEFDASDRALTTAGTGGGGSRYITLRATRPGRAVLQLSLVRPWLPNEKPINTFTLDVKIAEKPTGLPHSIQEALVAA